MRLLPIFFVRDSENLPDAKDSFNAENSLDAENLSNAEGIYVTKEDPRYPIVQLRYVELLTGNVNSYKEVMEVYKTKDFWIYKFNGKSKTELEAIAKAGEPKNLYFVDSSTSQAHIKEELIKCIPNEVTEPNKNPDKTIENTVSRLYYPGEDFCLIDQFDPIYKDPDFMKQIVKEACERFKTHSYAHKDKIELFKARGYDTPESLEVICGQFEALITESGRCVCIEERANFIYFNYVIPLMGELNYTNINTEHYMFLGFQFERLKKIHLKRTLGRWDKQRRDGYSPEDYFDACSVDEVLRIFRRLFDQRVDALFNATNNSKLTRDNYKEWVEKDFVKEKVTGRKDKKEYPIFTQAFVKAAYEEVCNNRVYRSIRTFVRRKGGEIKGATEFGTGWPFGSFRGRIRKKVNGNTVIVESVQAGVGFFVEDWLQKNKP